jgi:hypothetical protein
MRSPCFHTCRYQARRSSVPTERRRRSWRRPPASLILPSADQRDTLRQAVINPLAPMLERYATVVVYEGQTYLQAILGSLRLLPDRRVSAEALDQHECVARRCATTAVGSRLTREPCDAHAVGGLGGFSRPRTSPRAEHRRHRGEIARGGDAPIRNGSVRIGSVFARAATGHGRVKALTLPGGARDFGVAAQHPLIGGHRADAGSPIEVLITVVLSNAHEGDLECRSPSLRRPSRP